MEPSAVDTDAINSKSISFRTILLAAITFSVGALLLKTIISPVAKVPKAVPFSFPEAVPLNQWKITGHESTATPADKPAGDVVSIRQYQYTSANYNSSQLTISAYYLTQTDGDLKPFIEQKVGQVGPTLRQNSVYGTYSLFSAQGRVHLTSCLNPRSPATVTSDQFSRNRMIYDIRLSRLVPWLKGQQTLPDERCLWTQLSVPVSQYASEVIAHEAVEMAWTEWAQWWRPEF